MADLPSAAALFDDQLRYVAANGPWLDVFGIGGDTVIGRRHHELDPLSGPVIAELLRRALDGDDVESSELGEPDPAHQSRRFVLSARRRSGNGRPGWSPPSTKSRARAATVRSPM
jgi:PAS domain-containing protein